MSMGTPIVTLRVTEDMQERIEEALASRNARTSDTPWTVSDFIRHAVEERLDHIRRGRRPRHPKTEEVEPYAG